MTSQRPLGMWFGNAVQVKPHPCPVLLQPDAASRLEPPNPAGQEVLTLHSSRSESLGGTGGAPAAGAECGALLVSEEGCWAAEVETKASKELEAPEFNWGPWGLLHFYLFLVTYRIPSTLHKCFLDTKVKEQHSESGHRCGGNGLRRRVGGHRGA